MSWLILFGLLSLGVLVQAMAGEALSILGGGPDLALLLVVCWSMLRGSHDGSLAGLVGGLLLDLFSAVPFGVNTVLLGLVGFIAGLGEGSLSRGSFSILFSTALLATVAFYGAHYLLLQSLGWALPSAAYFARVTLPSAFLNALLMPLFFRLARRIAGVPSGWRALSV